MSNFEFLLCGVLLNHQSGQCLHVNHITSVGWWNDLACVPGDHTVSSWICHLRLPWTSSSRFPSLCFLICNETNITNLLDDHGCIWKALSTVYGISLPESIISYFSFLSLYPPTTLPSIAPPFLFFFLAVPKACGSSRARDHAYTTAVTILDP